MKITVKMALESEGLRSAKVLAGSKQLGNLVESISVLEVTETKVTNWVVKNEMYITSLYGVRDDVEAQKKLITSLHKYGCCALVVCHMGIFFEAIDQSVIDLCDEIGLPLIQAEPSTSYAQIIRPIIQLLLQEGNKLRVSEYEKLHDTFVELLANGQNMQSAFSVITSKAMLSVSYYDNECFCLYSNKNKQELQREMDFIQSHQSSIYDNCKKNEYWVVNIDPNQCLIYGIYDQGMPIGLLCITIPSDTSFSDLIGIADALSSICSLPISLQRKKRDVRDRIFQKFVSDLLTGRFDNEETAIWEGRNFGVIINDKTQLMVISLPPHSLLNNGIALTGKRTCNHERNSLKSDLEEFAVSIDKRSESLFTANEVVLLLSKPLPRKDREKATKELARIFAEHGLTAFSAGISDTYEGVDGISNAYRQSRDAANIGRMLYGENQLITYQQTYFSQKLMSMANDKEAVSFSERLFRPLIEYDLINNSNLMETMTLLLKHDLNTSLVANLLFLHRNSVLHRKNKIVEIYGYSPFEAPEYLSFITALQVLEFSSSKSKEKEPDLPSGKT